MYAYQREGALFAAKAGRALIAQLLPDLVILDEAQRIKKKTLEQGKPA